MENSYQGPETQFVYERPYSAVYTIGTGQKNPPKYAEFIDTLYSYSDSWRKDMDKFRAERLSYPYEPEQLMDISGSTKMEEDEMKDTISAYNILQEYLIFTGGACRWRDINPRLFGNPALQFQRLQRDLDEKTRICVCDLDFAMGILGETSKQDLLYRGVETIEEHEFFREAKVGDRFTNGIFMSTTDSYDVAMEFAKEVARNVAKKEQADFEYVRPIILKIRGSPQDYQNAIGKQERNKKRLYGIDVNKVVNKFKSPDNILLKQSNKEKEFLVNRNHSFTISEKSILYPNEKFQVLVVTLALEKRPLLTGFTPECEMPLEFPETGYDRRYY